MRRKKPFDSAGTLLEVDPVELALLDEATQRAEADIDAMVKVLDGNAEDHKAFMAEIAKLRTSTG